MSAPKTVPTAQPVSEFLAGVTDESRRRDCETVRAMMERATGRPAVMWGSAIVGCGRYMLDYANGTSAEWPVIAFSPRKTDLTLYIVPALLETPALMENIGKVKTGRTCLYIKRLSDVDLPTLETLVQRSVDAMQPKRVD